MDRYADLRETQKLETPPQEKGALPGYTFPTEKLKSAFERAVSQNAGERREGLSFLSNLLTDSATFKALHQNYPKQCLAVYGTLGQRLHEEIRKTPTQELPDSERKTRQQEMQFLQKWEKGVMAMNGDFGASFKVRMILPDQTPYMHKFGRECLTADVVNGGRRPADNSQRRRLSGKGIDLKR